MYVAFSEKGTFLNLSSNLGVILVKSIVEGAVQNKAKVEEKLEEFGAPKIMMIGAGGGGCNSVNRVAAMGIAGAQLVAVNTDKHALHCTRT